MNRTDTNSVQTGFSLDTIYEVITWNKQGFLAAFVIVLVFTYGSLYVVDFLPEPPAETNSTVAVENESKDQNDTVLFEVDDLILDDNKEVKLVTETPEGQVAGEMANDAAEISNSSNGTQVIGVNEISAKPVRMYIDALERHIPILNPTSRLLSDLDAALSNGAIRHPDAADFQREGNIVILGHSSRLPNVINRNYQIFNNIEDLQWGDVIRVYSKDTEYIYRVDRVYEAKASALVVPVADTGPRLTLVTCDTLGAIEDRFIVEAKLQSSRPIP